MTYQQALANGDLLARFCHTQLARFLPDLDPARAWNNARNLGLTAGQLGRLCALDPLTARLRLAA
ncbi:hypothetical protein [Streptomyces caniscabiei]|uniref:Uncharacterized protein n=1 Tax=Streptomyces caniscabiei TaxID=2746961 RepID=A0ABU4MPT7_9ACTN|nr:hypothetical protein [Streptomyces caniscabiei]MDX2954593.1 hypothetical protein [Streptomyces caniscabiei]MDX3039443.1 hypothetical protein [Streptomyces caniscabiei]